MTLNSTYTAQLMVQLVVNDADIFVRFKYNFTVYE